MKLSTHEYLARVEHNFGGATRQACESLIGSAAEVDVAGEGRQTVGAAIAARLCVKLASVSEAGFGSRSTLAVLDDGAFRAD
jgi:hypothetical protein